MNSHEPPDGSPAAADALLAEYAAVIASLRDDPEGAMIWARSLLESDPVSGPSALRVLVEQTHARNDAAARGRRTARAARLDVSDVKGWPVLREVRVIQEELTEAEPVWRSTRDLLQPVWAARLESDEPIVLPAETQALLDSWSVVSGRVHDLRHESRVALAVKRAKTPALAWAIFDAQTRYAAALDDLNRAQAVRSDYMASLPESWNSLQERKYRRLTEARDQAWNSRDVALLELSAMLGNRRSFSLVALIKRDGTRCNLCGVAEAVAPAMDHVVPLARGGVDAVMNLQVACGRCNLIKSDSWAGSLDPHRLAEALGVSPDYAGPVLDDPRPIVAAALARLDAAHV